MLKSALLLGAALALGPGPAVAQNKSVKIGFVSTFSGPTAVMGNDMRNSFELALDHLGRKMGGVPVEVIYEDDQQRPDVGKQKTDKLIESEKVDFIVGYIWSNVLLASIKSAVDSKTFLVTSNAGVERGKSACPSGLTATQGSRLSGVYPGAEGKAGYDTTRN
jgi:branched-chain amino acid transport system substrate-binding protein